MAVGLPGTGIGGLFYLLLGAVAPLRRGVRALRSEAEPKSPRSLLLTLGLLAGIVATMWGQAWLLGELIQAVRSRTGSGGHSGAIAVLTGPSAAVYMKWAGLAGLLGLGFLYCVVHLLKIVLRRRSPCDRPPNGVSSGDSFVLAHEAQDVSAPPSPSLLKSRGRVRHPKTA